MFLRHFDWRRKTTISALRTYNQALRMITQEERNLIPLVSRHGCVDLQALRKAWTLVKLQPNQRVREHLFMYYYLREVDIDQDEPMFETEILEMPSSPTSQQQK
jgi:thioredoxin-related protein